MRQPLSPPSGAEDSVHPTSKPATKIPQKSHGFASKGISSGNLAVFIAPCESNREPSSYIYDVRSHTYDHNAVNKPLSAT